MTSLYDSVTGNAIGLLSQIYRYTCRKQFVGLENFHQALDSGRPVILASWHGKAYMIMSSIISLVDPSSFHVLMPNDWRGGSLAVAARSLGAIPLPMNLYDDPTLGMGREMVKLVRHIMAGGNTFIAPDGPDGPAFVPKPGISYIARKTNALIVPIGAYCRHAYLLNRWDHYALPYPFSRISVHVCKPYGVASDEDDLSAMDDKLTDILHRVTAQATANYYAARPSWRKD